MDALLKQLAGIQYHIQQASVCGENGLVRLHLLMAIASISKFFVEVNNHMLALESEGEQPEEIFRS